MKKALLLIVGLAAAACGGSDSDPSPFASATPLTLGELGGGSIGSYSDFDYYEITVATGTINVQTFDADGVGCDFDVDPTVEVFNGAKTSVGYSDDSGINYCEDFNVAVTAGTYFLEVGGWEPFPFTYTVRVTQL